MKINNKIIRLKRFSKPICHCERSVAILVGLALVLSLGIVALPIVGTVEAWCEPNPTFITKANTGDPATNISIEWSTTQAYFGSSHSVHVFTTAVTTDYAMVGVVTDFVLTASTSISYLGYTVAGSGVKAPDEIWLEFSNGDVICNTGPQGTEGQWDEWTLSGSSSWYNPQTLSAVEITTFYSQTVVKVFLGAGSPTSAGVTVDVYLDNLKVNGETLLDDDTGEIDVLCGTFCGYTGDTGIQTAINAALPGDTINVAAGTYNERVVINKPLTLQGEDRDTTIIDGTGMTEVGIPAYGNNGILIFPGASYHTQAVDITISGFTVQNFAVIGAGGGAGIATDGTYQYKNITISDVIAKDNGMAGLEVSRALDSHFSDIVVDNNDQIGNGQGYGIWMMYDSSNDNFTNIVATNQIMGIYVLQANDNTFNNVNCTENEAGVYFNISNGNTVENSSMNNNDYGGVYFSDSNNNTVQNSILSGNGVRGAKCSSGTGNQIHHSNIENNVEFGVEAVVAIDATNNWWGDASGPTHTSNPGGTGDAVSDNVNFDPFLFPNVTITKTGPTTANQGNNITYTITYKNVGTFNATNVIVTETYPSEVEYVSATPEPDSGFNNQWTIGTLAPDAEGTITVTVHIK